MTTARPLGHQHQQQEHPQRTLIHDQAVGRRIEPRAQNKPVAPFVMSVQVGQGLHHDETDHAQRREAREQTNDDQQGQDEFGHGPGCNDGPVIQAQLGDIIPDVLHHLREYLRIGSQRRLENPKNSIAQLGHAGDPEIHCQNGSKQKTGQRRQQPLSAFKRAEDRGM